MTPPEPRLPVEVATAANPAYLPGLLATVGSALVSADPESPPMRFHILGEGFDDNHRGLVFDLVKRLSPESEVAFLQAPSERFAQCRRDFGGTFLTYARLLLPSLLPHTRRVLYLDSDLLVLRPLHALYRTDLQGNLAAAVPERNFTLGQDSPVPLAGPEAAWPYLNAGVFLADLEAWRQCGIESALLALLDNNRTNLKWMDQTALNHILKGRWLPLDPGANLKADQFSTYRGPAETIIHYTTAPKPWQEYRRGDSYALWRLAARRLIPRALWSCRPSWYRGYPRQIRAALLDRSPAYRRLVARRLATRDPGTADFLLNRYQSSRARASNPALHTALQGRWSEALSRR